ncbi:autophagy protein atg9 [Blyttiomyces sp. JEL0837]|nr:autophagy protein atg9 [Blyttiomyces sp. JEL0837]
MSFPFAVDHNQDHLQNGEDEFNANVPDFQAQYDVEGDVPEGLPMSSNEDSDEEAPDDLMIERNPQNASHPRKLKNTTPSRISNLASKLIGQDGRAGRDRSARPSALRRVLFGSTSYANSTSPQPTQVNGPTDPKDNIAFIKGFDTSNFDDFLKRADMDTLEWHEVVASLSKFKSLLEASHLPVQNLDAHSIANRIMRKDNYMIAMINREILDLRLPYIGRSPVLTKILEWNLSFCILSYVFDDKGSVKKRFLKGTNRLRLVSGLQKRFTFMALLNLIFAPFLIMLMILYFFFRYAEEYQKNPSALGARQYSPYAEWKFREFNELPHLLQRRLSRSYAVAAKYLDQFRKQRVIIVARFISFVAGSFAAVLAMLAIIDQDILVGFDITPGRSVLFYISVFGGILAATRGVIPDDNRVFEPERLLREVVEETHYLPDSWRNRMHSEEVKNQFSELFDFKISLFFNEILSVLYAPSILYFSLPKCSEAVVDFFRDFTLHVDSVGFVCSFAVFDFRANGNPRYGAPTDSVNHHLMSRNGKMEQSFVSFKANNPDWEPPDMGSQFLQSLSRVNPRGIGAREELLSSEGPLLRPRRYVRLGNGLHTVKPVTESVLGHSEMETEQEPLGIFGILDAVYMANQKMP